MKLTVLNKIQQIQLHVFKPKEVKEIYDVCLDQCNFAHIL